MGSENVSDAKVSQSKMRACSSPNLNVGRGEKVLHNSTSLKSGASQDHVFNFRFSNLAHLELFVSSFWTLGAAERSLPRCGSRDEWLVCWRALVTTPPGPINSQRLLEHQVMANQAQKLLPDLTTPTLRQLEPGPPGRTAGSLKKRPAEWFWKHCISSYPALFPSSL